MSETHLSTEQLGAALLGAEQQAHLSSCRRCRIEARWQGQGEGAPMQIGPYRVVGLIGSGGSGRVYAAVEERTGLRVAIKRLVLPTREALGRLAREVELLRLVAHEHVLPMIELIEAPGGPDLVLPYVYGPSLAALLEGEVSVGDKLALFSQVVRGAARLHAQGVVHRDLKPGNVLIDVSGEQPVAKICDLGLAKFLGGETLTREGVGLGTPRYMAPEQRRDAANADTRADVYALGVMLEELLAGARDPSLSLWTELVSEMCSEDPAKRPLDAGVLLSRMPEAGQVSGTLRSHCLSLVPEPVDERGIEIPAIPCALPDETSPFVGRDLELSELAGMVGEHTLVSVVGTAGVGKTCLCLRYARLWLEEYPGGVFFCDLSSAQDIDNIVFLVARSLDVPLQKGDAIEQLGYAISGRGRCLVLLDNLEQVAKHAQATLGRWLGLAPQARFLVTSRAPLELASEQLFFLSTLARSEAVALFVRRGLDAHPRWKSSAKDEVDIETLVELLDCLPLCIELAAARLAVMTPAKMLQRMGERLRLLAAPGRSDRHATLTAALDWSFTLLSRDEQRALCQISVFCGGFTEEAADSVLSLESVAPRDALGALIRSSLVRRRGGRLDLLSSVEAYAAERLHAGERASAEQRHAGYYAALGVPEALDRLVQHGGVERRQALVWELDNLVAASQRSLSLPLAVRAVSAAWAIFELRGPYDRAATLLEGIIARAGGSATLYRCAGGARRLGGHMEAAAAHYEAALAAARAGGELREEALAIIGSEGLKRDQGQPYELSSCEAALQIALSLGDRGLEGVVRASLGSALFDRGRFDEASRCFEEALVVHREVGDARSEGIALYNLGFIGTMKGELTLAQGFYEPALQVNRAVGNRRAEAIVHIGLGDIEQERGHMSEARAHFEAALAINREVGDLRSEGQTQGTLGRLYHGQCQRGQALECYEAALQITRKVGDRRTEAKLLHNVGLLFRQGGATEEAVARYRAALALQREADDRSGIADTLSSLGALLGELGQGDEAAAHHREALAIFRAVGDREGEGFALGNIGLQEQEMGNLAEARACCEAALAIHRENGNPRFAGGTLGYLGVISAAEGRLGEALDQFDEGARLLREVRDPLGLCQLLVERTSVEHAAGRTVEALGHLEEALSAASEANVGEGSALARRLVSLRATIGQPPMVRTKERP